jgi:hypothetical protein
LFEEFGKMALLILEELDFLLPLLDFDLLPFFISLLDGVDLGLELLHFIL